MRYHLWTSIYFYLYIYYKKWRERIRGKEDYTETRNVVKWCSDLANGTKLYNLHYKFQKTVTIYILFDIKVEAFDFCLPKQNTVSRNSSFQIFSLPAYVL